MDYKTLKWESLGYLREYLHKRITPSLTDALDKVNETKTLSPDDQTKTTDNLVTAEHQLYYTLMVMNAWNNLVAWKNGKDITDAERQIITPEQLPAWFVDRLTEKAVIKFEHSHAIFVNPDVFYESILLLVNITAGIGTLSHIMLNDAASPRIGVWLRIVFEPPDSGTYPSKLAILDRVDSKNPSLRDIPLQFAITEDMFEFNGCRISLQNNTRTGHQAFAVLLPIYEADPERRKGYTPKRQAIEGRPVPQTNASLVSNETTGKNGEGEPEPLHEGLT